MLTCPTTTASNALNVVTVTRCLPLSSLRISFSAHTVLCGQNESAGDEASGAKTVFDDDVDRPRPSSGRGEVAVGNLKFVDTLQKRLHRVFASPLSKTEQAREAEICFVPIKRSTSFMWTVNNLMRWQARCTTRFVFPKFSDASLPMSYEMPPENSNFYVFTES